MQDLEDQQEPISPIGAAVTADDERWAACDPPYRARREAFAPYREIAWLLIKYRMDHGLTQQQLAERVGASHSQISRIESGRQKTNLDTLLRIAHALDLKVTIGFESISRDGKAERQRVAF